MISTELRESVAALTPDERIELIAHIEQTLDDADAVPTEEQHALVSRRASQMKTDPTIGQSVDQHLADAQTLLG